MLNEYGGQSRLNSAPAYRSRHMSSDFVGTFTPRGHFKKLGMRVHRSGSINGYRPLFQRSAQSGGQKAVIHRLRRFTQIFERKEGVHEYEFHPVHQHTPVHEGICP
jgi:hypothetical protein